MRSPPRAQEVGIEADYNGVQGDISQSNGSRVLGSGELGFLAVSADEQWSVVAVVWGGAPGRTMKTVVEGSRMMRTVQCESRWNGKEKWRPIYLRLIWLDRKFGEVIEGCAR